MPLLIAEGAGLGYPRTHSCPIGSSCLAPALALPARPLLVMPGATDAGYRSSGWSRGHLVPAREMSFDEQAWLDSFLLSNAVPQNARMNRAEWRRLENQVRRIAETADSVIVVTGAIFTEDAERIGTGASCTR